jgi:hypothetical protein
MVQKMMKTKQFAYDKDKIICDEAKRGCNENAGEKLIC